jgi:ABC-2 type transport system permease protein
MVAPVPRYRIMIGRTLGGATISIFQGLVVLIISLFIGFHITNYMYIPLAIVFMFLIAFLFTAFGTAIASRLEDANAFPLIINFIIMPLFFLSGALFSLGELPSALKIVTTLNPLSYGVDGIRGALSGVFQLGLFADLSVLIVMIAIVGVISTYLFNKMEV